MSEIDRERCRLEAAECLERARLATDPDLKSVLRTRAQEWLKLAYSEPATEFERLVTDFNTEQMRHGERSYPPTQARMRHQPMQQQQQRKSEGGEYSATTFGTDLFRGVKGVHRSVSH
jgi:hypothetical protein